MAMLSDMMSNYDYDYALKHEKLMKKNFSLSQPLSDGLKKLCVQRLKIIFYNVLNYLSAQPTDELSPADVFDCESIRRH